MHPNLTKGFGMISPKDFFPLLDFAFMPNNSLSPRYPDPSRHSVPQGGLWVSPCVTLVPAGPQQPGAVSPSLQEQLRRLYPRLKVLALGARPEAALHTYFPSFLSRATPACPPAMKKEVSRAGGQNWALVVPWSGDRTGMGCHRDGDGSTGVMLPAPRGRSHQIRMVWVGKALKTIQFHPLLWTGVLQHCLVSQELAVGWVPELGYSPGHGVSGLPGRGSQPAVPPPQLLTSMSQCLSLDPLSFSVWRQLYTKHLAQSRSVQAAAPSGASAHLQNLCDISTPSGSS